MISKVDTKNVFPKKQAPVRTRLTTAFVTFVSQDFDEKQFFTTAKDMKVTSC